MFFQKQKNIFSFWLFLKNRTAIILVRSGPAPWADQFLNQFRTAWTSGRIGERLTWAVFDELNGSKPNPFPFFFPPLPEPTTAHFPLPSSSASPTPGVTCRGLHPCRFTLFFQLILIFHSFTPILRFFLYFYFYLLY